MLNGKSVVVGVCGGIAAYKVVEVVSRLKKMNADVNVIMTENATKFVSPLTFRSISHNPVVTDMFAETMYWDIQHISLAQKADIMLIAPATANIIGKVAAGIADDMLSTTVTATKAPVLFVPAMNFNMYENSIVQNNIAKLADLGYVFMEPETGLMAEGSSGKGRLPRPCDIVERVVEILAPKRDMEGVKVLITAGPTREPIDPVRYISNSSSGKMGYALASAALKRGASVSLVSGPVSIDAPDGVDFNSVTTAEEMYKKILEIHAGYDVIIFTAAVSDYRCKSVASGKIKKEDDEISLELVKNVDIAKELGKSKASKKIHIGFCAETDNLISNAKSKLASKNFDIIVANDVTKEGAGFNTDTNIVTIIGRDGSIKELPKQKKKDVAHRILDEVVELIKNENWR